MKKNVTVNRVLFHTGVQFKNKVKNSVDRIQDKAEMELHPMGVYVVVNGCKHIVPKTNIVDIMVDCDD